MAAATHGRHVSAGDIVKSARHCRGSVAGQIVIATTHGRGVETGGIVQSAAHSCVKSTGSILIASAYGRGIASGIGGASADCAKITDHLVGKCSASVIDCTTASNRRAHDTIGNIIVGRASNHIRRAVGVALNRQAGQQFARGRGISRIRRGRQVLRRIQRRKPMRAVIEPDSQLQFRLIE